MIARRADPRTLIVAALIALAMAITLAGSGRRERRAVEVN